MQKRCNSSVSAMALCFFCIRPSISITLNSQQGKSEGFESCDRPSNLKLDSNRQFFRPCDSEIWWMTSKNNRALLLYYVKLCASFQIHWWIQTGFTVQKRSIQVEIADMLSCVTLKFDGWPCKTIGHLFISYPLVNSNLQLQQVKVVLKLGKSTDQFWRWSVNISMPHIWPFLPFPPHFCWTSPFQNYSMLVQCSAIITWSIFSRILTRDTP